VQGKVRDIMSTMSEARGRASEGQGELALVQVLERREPVARVVSSRVNLRVRLLELWRARELFVFLVRKDLKVRYKGSVLGVAWSMLNPAVMLLVYYVVFTKFLPAGFPDFALYLFSGMIAWNLFQTALMGSSSVIVANAGIVKKVSFPREILALSQVGTATMFFFFQAIVLVVFLAGFQVAPVWSLLPLLVFALVDLIVLCAALAVFLSAVTVYLRDVEHLIAVLLMAWNWAIPMIYSYNRVAGSRHHWLGVLYLTDPLVPIVLTFQRVLYGLRTYGPPGHLSYVTAAFPISFYVELLAIVLAVSVVLFLIAMVVFGRIEGNFAEEL
jgi:ABC-2 type transport system permease protein